MQATFVSFPGPGRVEVLTEEVSAGDLGPLEVLVRSETSIISAGTELARLHGRDTEPMTWPYRPGYGVIGRVEAVGAGVGDFKAGDRVFFAGKHASLQRFQHGQDHQWGRLYPAPDSLDAVVAAFGCMAEIALTAPAITELTPGDTVAVFGLGLVGNLAAQMYRIAGARVIGLDPIEARCALARKVGIDEAVGVPPAEQAAAVRKLTGGRGADVTVDAAGHAAVIRTAVTATRKYGQVVLLGTPREAVQGNLAEVFVDIHRDGLVVRGAHMWRWEAAEGKTLKRTVPWAFATVFQYLASGQLKVRELASHVIPPSGAPDAYRGLVEERDKYVAAIIDWRKLA